MARYSSFAALKWAMVSSREAVDRAKKRARARKRAPMHVILPDASVLFVRDAEIVLGDCRVIGGWAFYLLLTGGGLFVLMGIKVGQGEGPRGHGNVTPSNL